MGRGTLLGLGALRAALRASEEIQVRVLSVTRINLRLLDFIESSMGGEEVPWMETIEDGIWALKDGTAFEEG